MWYITFKKLHKIEKFVLRLALYLLIICVLLTAIYANIIFIIEIKQILFH